MDNLFAGISGFLVNAKEAQDTVCYPVSDYPESPPKTGWQLSPESVAAFKWNGWQDSRGIGGRIGPEYADAHMQSKDMSITQQSRSHRSHADIETKGVFF